MVIVSPLNGVVGPLQMAFSWLINWGDPNHLLIGVILQVGPLRKPIPKMPGVFSALKIWAGHNS